jgi:hypothetical protein
VIANCPGCGTHYKHEPPKIKVRARCGRCDTSLDLGRLRPYRILRTAAPTAEQAARAASHLPIGLDHPALATTIAENLARNTTRAVAPPVPLVRPARPAENWENEDPLPQIPEMTLRGAYESSAGPISGVVQREDPADLVGEPIASDPAPAVSAAVSGRGATIALWVAAGAIAGTGASWTMGGTTLAGAAGGAAFGAAAGWIWMRWTSPK